MSKYMERITELMNDTPAFDIIRLQAERDTLRGEIGDLKDKVDRYVGNRDGCHHLKQFTYGVIGGLTETCMACELDDAHNDLTAAVDILAELEGYGVAMPDEAYELIETYHGKL
jgi:hypothetical protein